MIVLLAIAWSLLLVPLSGGRLRSLAELRLDHEGLLVVLFVLQGFLRGRLPGIDAVSPWAVTMWAAVCLILIVLLLPSRWLPGVAPLVVGLGSNVLVTLANAGMPYVALDPSAKVESAFYLPANGATHLVWFGDVLPDPSGRLLLSFGDLLLLVGCVSIVLYGATQSYAAQKGAKDAVD